MSHNDHKQAAEDQTNGKKGKLTVAEAGSLGGQKTLERKGSDFYKKIGAKGGRSRARNAAKKRADQRNVLRSFLDPDW